MPTMSILVFFVSQEVDPKVLVDDPPLMAEIESMFSRTKQIVDEKVRCWVGLGFSLGLG